MRPSENRYLLRVWREEERGGLWQATLRNVADGDLTAFDDLDRLVEYLKSTATEADEGAGEPDSATEGTDDA